MTSENMLTALLEYRSIGSTGVVYRSAGMDLPVRVVTDENMKPTGEAMMSGKYSYYHPLNETPTFLFTLPDMSGVKVENLALSMSIYYLTECKACFFNFGTGEWDEITPNENVKNAARYVDAEGRVYVQFRPDTQDMYAEVPAPMITVQGRLEHAEN